MAKGYRDYRVIRKPDGILSLLDDGEMIKSEDKVVGTVKIGLNEDRFQGELQDLLAMAVAKYFAPR